VGELHRIKTKLLRGLLWSEKERGELTMTRWSAVKGGRGSDPVEAPGYAEELRKGTSSDSCCWRLAAHRGGLAVLGQRRGGMAHSEENQRGGAGAVASLEAT
jgi:hypothetical protein